jgi:hypothetical protein
LTVRGVHPHGTVIVSDTRHVGTGQRIVGQSAGLIVRVTRGQGSVVDVEMVVRVGRVMTLVMTAVLVGVVRGVVVGRVQREEKEVVAGQGTAEVRISMSQPW